MPASTISKPWLPLPSLPLIAPAHISNPAALAVPTAGYANSFTPAFGIEDGGERDPVLIRKFDPDFFVWQWLGLGQFGEFKHDFGFS
jgi:hypothetical protein